MITRILASVAVFLVVAPACSAELIETQDCASGQCTENLPPAAFCQADVARKVLGEDASTSQSFYADYQRDVAGQWLFKMRSPAQVVSLRLTEQEFDESSGRVGFAFRGAFLSGVCHRYTGQQLTSPASYQTAHEHSRRAGAGSYWNYEFADEITGKRFVFDTIVTEIANGNQVMRINTRGVDNPRIQVLDPSLGVAQSNTSKFSPPLRWMTDELRVGAKSSWSGTQTVSGAQGPGSPKPMRCESQIVGREQLVLLRQKCRL